MQADSIQGGTYEAAKSTIWKGASAEELKTLLTNLQSAKAGLKNAAVESAKETLKAEVDKAENKNIYEVGNADGTYTKDVLDSVQRS